MTCKRCELNTRSKARLLLVCLVLIGTTATTANAQTPPAITSTAMPHPKSGPQGSQDTPDHPVSTLDPRLRVLWTLKDADGLDRVRIHDLDVTRLRSEAAQVREAEAWRLYEEVT